MAKWLSRKQAASERSHRTAKLAYRAINGGGGEIEEMKKRKRCASMAKNNLALGGNEAQHRMS